MMALKEEVQELLRPGAWCGELPLGATAEQIEDFEKRMELRLPDELRQWLTFCNGPLAGPAGLLGLRPDDSRVDVSTALKPVWKQKGWIPLAGDGFGNYYVLDTQTMVGATHPV